MEKNERNNKKNFFSELIGSNWFKKLTNNTEMVIFLIFLSVCILMAILSPYFLKPANIMNILRQISNVGVVSVGMAMVIITGGIDLSVGANLALCSCVAAVLAQSINPWLAVVCAIIVGGVVGLANGFLSVKIGIASFIATLGMQQVCRGLAYLITGGIPVQYRNSTNFLGGGTIPITEKVAIPISVIIMFVIYGFGIVFMNKTVSGRYMYAVGDNEKSTRLSGVKTDKIRILAFVITGMLAGFAGVLNAGNLTTAEAGSASGLEQDSIAAVVIGGVSMSGGEGSMVGMLIGAAFMGVIRNGFILLSFPHYLQTFTIGLLIIVAVGIDSYSKKRKRIA